MVFGLCYIGFSDFSQSAINNLNYLNLPKGRTELINNIPANVIIDFAHNAEGLELFLSSIKNYFSKLIVVFGCGGDRDRSKRPKMMQAAIANASDIIFTTDNSRSEDFSSIFEDAVEGNKEEKIIPIIKANPKLSVDDSYSLDSFSVIPSDLKNIILNAIDLENITIKEINK